MRVKSTIESLRVRSDEDEKPEQIKETNSVGQYRKNSNTGAHSHALRSKIRRSPSKVKRRQRGRYDKFVCAEEMPLL